MKAARTPRPIMEGQRWDGCSPDGKAPGELAVLHHALVAAPGGHPIRHLRDHGHRLRFLRCSVAVAQTSNPEFYQSDGRAASNATAGSCDKCSRQARQDSEEKENKQSVKETVEQRADLVADAVQIGQRDRGPAREQGFQRLALGPSYAAAWRRRDR